MHKSRYEWSYTMQHITNGEMMGCNDKVGLQSHRGAMKLCMLGFAPISQKGGRIRGIYYNFRIGQRQSDFHAGFVYMVIAQFTSKDGVLDSVNSIIFDSIYSAEQFTMEQITKLNNGRF
jgi:hypothetical protein